MWHITQSPPLDTFIFNVWFNNNMQEKSYFSNSKGNKICGILSNPTSELSTPVIILCHGFTTSKNNFTNTKLEKMFNEQKIPKSFCTKINQIIKIICAKIE